MRLRLWGALIGLAGMVLALAGITVLLGPGGLLAAIGLLMMCLAKAMTEDK